MQLEPACVVVCPVQAIIAGDIDDPGSHISQVIASAKVTARKPQKGTRPKLFYVGVDGDLTQPSMTEAAPNYMFAERHCSSTNLLGDKTAAPALTLTCTDGDRSNPGAARVVYDVAHPQPWAWIPAFYLWTKSIGAGVLMVAALFLGLVAPFEAGSSQFLFRVTVPGTALLFTGLTALLLIADLHRPDRFYYILFKPNLRSWLVLGTWILIIYSILAAIWLIHGVVVDDLLPPLLVVMTAIAAGCSAGYSAFLFAQAKGRDLWQSPVFLWHLLVQAIMAGAAAMIILAVLAGYPHIPKMLDGGRETVRFSNFVLVVAITLSILMIFGELTMTPVSVDVRYASEVILRGRLRALFWLGVVGLGTILPAGILSYIFATADTSRSLEIPAAVASLAGLLMFEKVWIDAGQAPPLS
jgi:formate-dependent nitrite reductase membrane component NrfD